MKENESVLGNTINQLESQVQENLEGILDILEIKVDEEKKELLTRLFISSANASNTIQKLIHEELDKLANMNSRKTNRVVKNIKKAEKKAATKKNRPRGKTSMKKND